MALAGKWANKLFGRGSIGIVQNSGFAKRKKIQNAGKCFCCAKAGAENNRDRL